MIFALPTWHEMFWRGSFYFENFCRMIVFFQKCFDSKPNLAASKRLVSKSPDTIWLDLGPCYATFCKSYDSLGFARFRAYDVEILAMCCVITPRPKTMPGLLYFRALLESFYSFTQVCVVHYASAYCWVISALKSKNCIAAAKSTATPRKFQLPYFEVPDA